VLRLIGTLARIAFGLALASMAAGLVTVLFVDIDVLMDPTSRLPKTLAETFDLALLAATHIAIFASLFVLFVAAIGEWFSIRSLAFYLLAGVVIALLGFSAQYASEVAGQATILNNYAIKAFLTVGFVGGFVYWLAAGQFAGRSPERTAMLDEGPAEPDPATSETTNTSVVITHPAAIEERPRWRMPSLERLRFASREASSESTSPADASRQD
jgi:hypothetical protein